MPLDDRLRAGLREIASEVEPDVERGIDLALSARRPSPIRRVGTVLAYATAMGLGIAVIGLGASTLLDRDDVGSTPSPSVGPSPSVEPSLSAAPRASAPPRLDMLPEGVLTAGTYEIDAVFPVRLTFTVPDGFGHGEGASDWVWIEGPGGGPGGIEFQIASNVYPDPCHSLAGANPPIGPSVDDLVAAMTTLVGFQAGPVADITIGGLPAKAFDLTNEIAERACDVYGIRTFIFADSSGWGGSDEGRSERIYVMNVQGTRLMIMTYYYSDKTGSADAANAATLAAIVQSISFP